MIRIVWRFSRGTVRLQDLNGSPSPTLEQLNLPAFARVSPVFLGDRVEVQARIEKKSRIFQEVPDNDLVRYYQAYVPDDGAPPVLQELERARSQGLVEWFDQQTRIGPPTKAPTGALVTMEECQSDIGPEGPTRPFEACQRYLDIPDSAQGRKQGVGARHAWTLRGGRGSAATLVDLDTGWNLDHEEFSGRRGTVVPFGTLVDDFHGTSVLGIIWGNPNDGVGVTGIVPEVSLGLAPFDNSQAQEPNPERMVETMAQKLTKGDVLLIEVDSNRGVLELPIEAFPLGFAAINAAHEAGIYVVEAAGNGGLELTKNLGIDPFGPALLIGAGNPATGKATAFSNFGERVDLQGWGQEVVTTGSPFQGSDDLQRRSDKNACYMKSFDGTSSAAAIVASCVASISSILRSHALDLPTPSALRTLLNKRGTFTDQAANGGIGALPNLKAALDDLEQAVGGGFRFDRI